jgi:hypothetical protein
MQKAETFFFPRQPLPASWQSADGVGGKFKKYVYRPHNPADVSGPAFGPDAAAVYFPDTGFCEVDMVDPTARWNRRLSALGIFRRREIAHGVA